MASASLVSLNALRNATQSAAAVMTAGTARKAKVTEVDDELKGRIRNTIRAKSSTQAAAAPAPIILIAMLTPH